MLARQSFNGLIEWLFGWLIGLLVDQLINLLRWLAVCSTQAPLSWDTVKWHGQGNAFPADTAENWLLLLQRISSLPYRQFYKLFV
jgi:hypothetical protein